MKHLSNKFEACTEERYAQAFRRTFQEAHRISQRLALHHVGRKPRHLRELLGFALENQSSSEYPFVLKYSFCQQERDGRKIGRLAAAVHLLQTSTLITDDIFDSAALRYHHPTIHRRFDASYAFLAGELLQSVALECISEELERGKFPNQVPVLRLFHQIIKDLYLGQYLDVYNSSNRRLTRREYLRVIELGAGRFFANLARCGALLASKPRGVAENLASYGYHYGMALFITDDIRDILQEPAETGKDFASDLRGRRMRLPMIYALKLSNRQDITFLQDFLQRKDTSRATIREVAKRIRKSGALEACQILAKEYLDRSLKSLCAMEGSLSAESLQWLSRTLFQAQGLSVSTPELR